MTSPLQRLLIVTVGRSCWENTCSAGASCVTSGGSQTKNALPSRWLASCISADALGEWLRSPEQPTVPMTTNATNDGHFMLRLMMCTPAPGPERDARHCELNSAVWKTIGRRGDRWPTGRSNPKEWGGEKGRGGSAEPPLVQQAEPGLLNDRSQGDRIETPVLELCVDRSGTQEKQRVQRGVETKRVDLAGPAEHGYLGTVLEIATHQVARKVSVIQIRAVVGHGGDRGIGEHDLVHPIADAMDLALVQHRVVEIAVDVGDAPGSTQAGREHRRRRVAALGEQVQTRRRGTVARTNQIDVLVRREDHVMRGNRDRCQRGLGPRATNVLRCDADPA